MSGLALLAEQVGVNERTLRRAVNEGTLRATRPTPRKLEMDLVEREYVRCKWSLLSTLRETLRTEPNVRFALLFGSMAAGTDTPDSDVDVLVDLRNASFERLVDLGTKLKEILGRHVDLVELHEAQSDPAFLALVVAEGRVLVDREDIWARLQGREAGGLGRRAGREESRCACMLALAPESIASGGLLLSDGRRRASRKVDRKRWRRMSFATSDFPRHMRRLETRSAPFGGDFDLRCSEALPS